MGTNLRTSVLAAWTRLLGMVGLCPDTLSLRATMARVRRDLPGVCTVIDVGASNGCWSQKVSRFFPEARFFLVEAQQAHEQGLRRAKARNPRFDFTLCAAGDRDGEIYFDASGLFGGLASPTPLAGNCVTVPVRRIDSLVREWKLAPPFVIKLDTHGFEVPILDGALETLQQTALIVVEAYNFTLTPDSLRFHEMCSWLEARGFRCIDLCEPMHRPKDGAFWQVDLFFVPTGRAEFASNSYE